MTCKEQITPMLIFDRDIVETRHNVIGSHCKPLLFWCYLLQIDTQPILFDIWMVWEAGDINVPKNHFTSAGNCTSVSAIQISYMLCISIQHKNQKNRAGTGNSIGSGHAVQLSPKDQ